jgi:tetratricopeptide (TPR) repeat protein
MTNIFRLGLLALMTNVVFAQQPSTPANHTTEPATTTTSSSLRAISSARETITKNPADPSGYTALGLALCHRGQEISDARLYSEADDALNTALRLSPNNFEAMKAQVCVQLGRHQFVQARDLAMDLNKRIPDDLMVYGLLVDANSALGNYPEAENAAQWMLNLRPGNTPAFLHAAELREVFGEQQGALQLLKLVLDATSPTDPEGRANVLTRMAQVNLEIGNLTDAGSQVEQALALQPDNFRTLSVAAKIRLLQAQPADSVQLLRQSYKSAPRTDTLYWLAEAMQSAGMQDEAKTTFADFERRALAESSHPDNANRELVFYYADHADSPAKSLQIAEQEVAERHDVHTLDAYAWALYKNGRYAESKKQMDIALKVGVREAPMFYLAGEIEVHLGNNAEAEHYFRTAAEMNSASSQQARTALASVEHQTQSVK